MTSPRRATELLANEQWEPAFEALLAAWRSHRVPELARAITALSDHLTTAVDPIDANADGWEQEWERRARAKRAIELGVLLPLTLAAPKGGITRRIRLLAEFGPDPRIGAVFLDAIDQPPSTASSNFTMWTELFKSLPAHIDASARPRLEARIAERGGASQFWTKLEKWVGAALAKLAEPDELPKPWKPELVELERAIAGLAKREGPRLAEPAKRSREPSASVTTTTDLAGARAKLDAGERATALDLLVGYWGGRRSPVVAALIERLGLIVDASQAPPAGTTKKAVQAAWMEAAQNPAPSQIGPLLASIRDAQMVDLEMRLEQLVGWQPDPRVAHGLMLLIKDHMIGARPRLWKAVYDGLAHHADPRDAAEIRHRHDVLTGPQVFHRRTAEQQNIHRVFEAFTAAVTVEHDLTSDQLEHAEAIEQALATELAEASVDDGIERSLVEAIVGDWDNDGPRLVYSDWLQSQKDPRGEFMALDLALAQGKKVKGAREKYFKAHLHALFGPILPILGYRTRFERGLLVETNTGRRFGGIDLPEDQKQALFNDLRWATLRSLAASHDEDGVAELFASAPLLGLDELTGASLAALQGFARRQDTVPIRRLAVSAGPTNSDEDWDGSASSTMC